jgi:hypothetical protein
MIDYLDISVDLETWGKRAGFDLRSIGAAPFDINGIVDYSADDYFYTAVDNPIVNEETQERMWALKRDPETVQWWSEQSQEARAAFINPVRLDVGLQLFVDWLDKLVKIHNRPIRMWAHGAAFDPPILAEAFEVVLGYTPWFYRAPRDTRTAFDFADIDDHTGLLKRFNAGVQHHALYDAITQARAITYSYSIRKRVI